MFLSMASGLYRPLPDLPKFFWRYPMAYISFTSWAVQVKSFQFSFQVYLAMNFNTAHIGIASLKKQFCMSILPFATF